MANSSKVAVKTTDGEGLLSKIKKAIEDGKIDTWEYKEFKDLGGYFTHSASQWNKKAWLKPSVEPSGLVLTIHPPQGETLTPEVRGIYLGRVQSMLVTHFDDKFTEISTK